MAANTVRPKKNGKPQSKALDRSMSPPTFAADVLALIDRMLSIVKLTVPATPVDDLLTADRVNGANGQ